MFGLLNNLSYYKKEQMIKKPNAYFDFDENYRYFVCHYHQIEIISDVVVFDYQKAINENRYFEKEYPNFAKELWLFADNCAGDEWFLHKITKKILFYDHEQGEYSSFDDFLILPVDFKEFIELLVKIREFELSSKFENPQQYFKENLYKLNPDFFNNYPYQLY